MALGSSKSWRQVLSIILPNKHSLDGEALLEYYAPVKEWLELKNKENGVKIGWNHSKKSKYLLMEITSLMFNETSAFVDRKYNLCLNVFFFHRSSRPYRMKSERTLM